MSLLGRVRCLYLNYNVNTGGPGACHFEVQNVYLGTSLGMDTLHHPTKMTGTCPVEGACPGDYSNISFH